MNQPKDKKQEHKKEEHEEDKNDPLPTEEQIEAYLRYEEMMMIEQEERFEEIDYP